MGERVENSVGALAVTTVLAKSASDLKTIVCHHLHAVEFAGEELAKHIGLHIVRERTGVDARLPKFEVVMPDLDAISALEVRFGEWYAEVEKLGQQTHTQVYDARAWFTVMRGTRNDFLAVKRVAEEMGLLDADEATKENE